MIKKRVYACGWRVVVQSVDQYGVLATGPGAVIWQSPLFPTHEEAKEELTRVTRPHPYVPDRRVWTTHPDPYHDCYVHYTEELESEYWE